MDYKHIILYLCICGVMCYPTKPLDDRPSELAWQAWLLIDSQNSNEGDRRITPKSIFFAPNIGDNGSSLPDCAEGYRSDPMGRCIKFVKVDEAAHLDFLLQRLNAMYATKSSLEFDDESKPTSGPLQVNIPLGGGEMEDEKPDIAIIVAPTNGNFERDDDEVKFDKRTQNKIEKEQITTEAVKEETTTEEITTEDIQKRQNISTSTTTESTTTTTKTTSAEDLQALFFLLPKNNTKNHTSLKETPITTEEASTYTNIEEETFSTNTEEETESTQFDFTETTVQKLRPNPIFEPNLKSEFTVQDNIHFDRLSEPNFEKLVRFPSDTEKVDIPEAHRLSSSEIEHLFEDYISQKPDLKDINLHRRRPSDETFLDDISPQLQRPYYNHRNRDKTNFWRPTFRTEENSQKPLVLRFNRHHPYSQERSGEQMRYYEDRSQEFYGRKRRRGNLR